MEYIGIVLGIVAIAIAWFKKPKEVVRYESDLTLNTENRIKLVEENQKYIGRVLQNYDLKAKKK